MIKQITFENWKSFRNATLYIDPLTVLIGTNGSGKSNALEGLAFLNRIAHGQHIRYALEGDDKKQPAIRGGAKL